jgi:hypothetical protein
MSTPLLTTKLHIPQLRLNRAPRPCLIRQLGEGVGQPHRKTWV